MRSHPVSGKCGLFKMAGMALVEGEGAATGQVEEDEEDEEGGICVGRAAAASAALTLGSRRQKEGALALCKKPRSRPVLCRPPGAESGQRLWRTRAGGCSGCITLQLATGCCGDTQTHGWGAGHCILHQTHTKVPSKYTALFSRHNLCQVTSWSTNQVDVKWPKIHN